MRISIFILSFIFAALFTQCHKEQIQTEVKLSKITHYHYFPQPNPTVQSEINVRYENDLATQIGRSKFIYDTQGRVDKEIILFQNPPGNEMGEEIHLIYQYTYNTKGQIKTITLTNDASKILDPLKAIPPNKKFIYEGTKIKRIESSGKYLPKTTTDYLYENAKLVRVNIESEGNDQSNPLVPQGTYDAWGAAPPSSIPNTPTSSNLSLRQYRVESTQEKNYLAETFKSLGFIPSEVNPYPFDVSFVPHFIHEYSILLSENEGSVDGLSVYFDRSLTFDVSQDNRLQSIMMKTPKGVDSNKIEFEYE